MPLEVLTLTDPSGSRARILPGLGFNCFSFEAATRGEPLELLWSAPDLPGGAAKPSRSGIPLLFPFAGRIRGTQFEFEGQEFSLPVGDDLGNAIHGFVISRPWRVIQQSARIVVGQFQASVDDPELLKHWPADFRLTAEYRLQGNCLSSEFVIENPDVKPLPFGFGAHGYFRVPLGGPNAGDCQVRVPVSEVWELAGLLPTGRKEPSPLAESLARGMAIGDTKLDHVFSGVKFDGHLATASIHDPHARRTLQLTFGDEFSACVVFNPPHREAICIEPYTTIPDPFTLRRQGIDPSLRILGAGQSFRARIDMSLVE